MLKYLLAAFAVITSVSLAADADAFGGRGYARRQARSVYRAPAPVIVRRVPVIAPAYSVRAYRPAVSVNIGTGGYQPYGSSYYGSGYRGYGYGYPSYRGGYPAYRSGGVSIGIGW
ncbi:hypothetical protein [Rubripirellula reticaptiva]|uniref:Uncharacterized protein n=1 Tax=Rubripirellula reticaptiva TaxID=2528013 RepID=A0A5C6EVX1_9BACT|nr:hypothetical protein [Rubripirellula reticaptiva]TWU51816.1 hypothetical protein Poly59_34110 [Rubripirellula reticaptiva]